MSPFNKAMECEFATQMIKIPGQTATTIAHINHYGHQCFKKTVNFTHVILYSKSVQNFQVKNNYKVLQRPLLGFENPQTLIFWSLSHTMAMMV